MRLWGCCGGGDARVGWLTGFGARQWSCGPLAGSVTLAGRAQCAKRSCRLQVVVAWRSWRRVAGDCGGGGATAQLGARGPGAAVAAVMTPRPCAEQRASGACLLRRFGDPEVVGARLAGRQANRCRVHASLCESWGSTHHPVQPAARRGPAALRRFRFCCNSWTPPTLFERLNASCAR